MKNFACLWMSAPLLAVAAPALAAPDSPRYEPYGAEYAPTAPYDEGAYAWNDRVYSEQDSQTGVYDGTWTGNYVDDQGRVYQGEWNGTYVDENGQAYRGNYRGTSVGAPRYGYETGGNARAPYAQDGDYPVAYRNGDRRYAPGYDSRYPRQDNGVGGAVIGGVAGGIAGNLIGGRGNRLAGTLIGGGLGAAAGYAIDRAEDRGRTPVRGYTDGRPYDPRYADPRYADRAGAHYVYGTPTGYGWQGQPVANGYYAQPQNYGGTTTTVVVVPGQTTSTTTTTVTEEYVDVSSGQRR